MDDSIVVQSNLTHARVEMRNVHFKNTSLSYVLYQRLYKCEMVVTGYENIFEVDKMR